MAITQYVTSAETSANPEATWRKSSQSYRLTP
jgi:hypothetical protein